MNPASRLPATIVAIITVAALLTGCGGDPSQPTADDRELDRIEESAADRCGEPPERLLRAISARLTTEAELEHPTLVDSEGRDDLHFLAAELSGEELDREPPIGVWAVLGDLEEAPAVLSVNAVARYLSDWPDGTRPQHGLTMEIDGAEASEECVKGAAE